MKTRTLLDELGQNWPNMNTTRLRILAVVSDHPGICMTEAAESLNMDVKQIHFHACTLGDGQRGRESFGLLQITECAADNRKRLMKLTDLGLKAAKLFAPINQKIADDMRIGTNENQMDLLSAK